MKFGQLLLIVVEVSIVVGAFGDSISYYFFGTKEYAIITIIGLLSIITPAILFAAARYTKSAFFTKVETILKTKSGYSKLTNDQLLQIRNIILIGYNDPISIHPCNNDNVVYTAEYITSNIIKTDG